MNNELDLSQAESRRQLGLAVQDTVKHVLHLSTASLADPTGILSYFSDAVEGDIASNVNGYDRLIEDWSKTNSAPLLGAIVNNVASELCLIYGPNTIQHLRKDVFGPTGGCATHGKSWVSRAVKLFAGNEYRIETCVEDFILWLTIRAAKTLRLEGGYAATTPEKK